MTEIILGATKEMVEERKALLSEIAELEKKMDSFVLDLKYVERLVKEKLATEKHRNILLRIQEEYPVTKERLDICKNRCETLEELISNNTSSRLSCHHIYPPTRIRIGSESIVVQEERFRCDVYYSDGEIHFAYR